MLKCHTLKKSQEFNLLLYPQGGCMTLSEKIVFHTLFFKSFFLLLAHDLVAAHLHCWKIFRRKRDFKCTLCYHWWMKMGLIFEASITQPSKEILIKISLWTFKGLHAHAHAHAHCPCKFMDFARTRCPHGDSFLQTPPNIMFQSNSKYKDIVVWKKWKHDKIWPRKKWTLTTEIEQKWNKSSESET